MARKARLFRNGGSQAVRLPQAFRFAEGVKEVLVHREGRRIIVEPPDDWPPEFLKCLGAWPDDIERPPAAAIALGTASE